MKYFMNRSNKLEALETMTFTCVHDAIIACVEQFYRGEITLASVISDNGNLRECLFVVSSTDSDYHLLVAYEQTTITLPYYKVSAKLHELFDNHTHYYVSVGPRNEGVFHQKYDTIDDAIDEYAKVGTSLHDGDVVLLYDEEQHSLGSVIFSAIGLSEGFIATTTYYDKDRRVMSCNFDDIVEDTRFRLFELEQQAFKQAEAKKAESSYLLTIGRSHFRFEGESASEMIYSVIQALFTSISRDHGKIIIRELNTGAETVIEFAKGLEKACVKINDAEYESFNYCRPSHNRKLQEYIRKQVIL